MSTEPGPRTADRGHLDLGQATLATPGGRTRSGARGSASATGSSPAWPAARASSSWSIIVRHRGVPGLEAVPAIRADTTNFLTDEDWFPDSTPSVFGIAALAWGTLLSSVTRA